MLALHSRGATHPDVRQALADAIKHAFEEGRAGQIRLTIGRHRDIIVTVDDDDLPFPAPHNPHGGIGMGLVKRMMASIDGLFISPPPGSKLFELRMPAAATGDI